ncbi:kinase-like domain containing protein [Rhypophila decipiens]
MDPDDDGGWQKVLPRVGGERLLSRAELEAHERQILKEWEASRGHWSGIGKHTPANDFADAKKLHHHRFKRPSDKPLGSGSFGLVEKVHYVHSNRTICLARKQIPYQRRRTIEIMREEANVMEKLDHNHIVKLVGTYCVKPNELFILLWPVAVCNLDELFNDLDALKSGHGDNDILAGLEALELRQTGNATNSITAYLQQLIGCITRAVAYCHEANIRHLDLKPSNILLNPGRVYLADFGIARDVHDRDCTMTIGPQGTPKWRAPEILNQDDEWSMKAADVYSLGLILLNIASVLYGADLVDFDAVIGELSPRRRAEKLEAYIGKLEGIALATQTVADPNAPTFAPRHILQLTSRMLSFEASRRPVATQVDAELVELGGLDQIYHSSCCKKSPRYMTDRMSNRLKVVTDERNRLLSDNQKLAKRVQDLEGRDEMYEQRLNKERANQAKQMAKLQAQLENEKAERMKVEAQLEEMKRTANSGRRNAPTRQSVSRPGAPERPMSSPSHLQQQTAGGLMMRTRRTHPLPPAQSQPQRKPSIHTMAVVPHSPQPTYLAQTAASSNRTATVPPSGPMRRVSMPRAPASSPGPQSLLPVTNSPTPECHSPGFPLRSRNSGSRLPQPVNPATPIRSGTPITLSRDPSSTDSTQASMISSTFSRLSGHSRYSGGGTPALEGSPFGDKTTSLSADNGQGGSPERRISNGAGAPSISPESTFTYTHHQETGGLGLWISQGDTNANDKASTTMQGPPAVPVLMPRRESVRSDRTSIASPVLGPGGSVTGTGSVASNMSSPRAAYAALDSQSGHMRIPGLPTARSWAEVAIARPVALIGRR